MFVGFLEKNVIIKLLASVISRHLTFITIEFRNMAFQEKIGTPEKKLYKTHSIGHENKYAYVISTYL